MMKIFYIKNIYLLIKFPSLSAHFNSPINGNHIKLHYTLKILDQNSFNDYGFIDTFFFNFFCT